MASRRGNSVERYYAGKQKHIKARRRKIYATLILSVLIILLVLSLTVFFNIRTFRVQGNTAYTSEQILSAMELEKGDNLFRLNKFKLAEKLTETLPYVGNVEIYRKLPTTLCIDIQETKAVWAAYHKGEYVLMDKNGKVLEIRKTLPEKLTLLIGVKLSEANVGRSAVYEKETVSTTLNNVLGALYEHFETGEISAVNLTELTNLTVYCDAHRVKVILGGSEKLGDKVQMARSAYEQNGRTEHARIDVSDPSIAYYKPLSDTELDDVLAIFHGKAKPVGEDLGVENSENESERDNSDENSPENEE